MRERVRRRGEEMPAPRAPAAVSGPPARPAALWTRLDGPAPLAENNTMATISSSSSSPCRSSSSSDECSTSSTGGRGGGLSSSSPRREGRRRRLGGSSWLGGGGGSRGRGGGGGGVAVVGLLLSVLLAGLGAAVAGRSSSPHAGFLLPWSGLQQHSAPGGGRSGGGGYRATGPSKLPVPLKGEEDISATASAAGRNGGGDRAMRSSVGMGSSTAGAMGWMPAGGGQEGAYLGGYGAREGDGFSSPTADDEAGLVEEIVDELVARRGLGVSGVMEAVRRTRPRDLAHRWPAWRRNCDCLLSLGFSPANVTTILQGSVGFLHELDPEADIRRVCFYLWEDLGFESWGKIGLGHRSWQKHKYKVVTKAPSVLRRKAEGGVEDTVATLEQVGMPTKYVLDAAFRLPSLLNVAPSVIFVVSAYLASAEVGFKPRDLGTLYRRNPWLLAPRTVESLRPIVAFLRDSGLSVQRVHVVLRGYPQLVLRDVVADLQPRVALLQSLGIPLQQIGCMIESFPQILALDAEEQVLPVLRYFQAELGFSRYDLWMMLRSFPAVLDLDLRQNIRPVVKFLKEELGVRNCRAFVKRLPPLLGYPVDWELRKKLAIFAELVPTLDKSELEAFPGYFAYDLHDRIIPRLRFIHAQGRQEELLSSIVLLRVALTKADAAFAEEFVQVDAAEYEAFFQDYKARTKRDRAERNAARRREQQQRHRGGGSGGGAAFPEQEEAVCD